MPFPFYSLPGEIRNHILRLLLTHRTPIKARSARNLAPPTPTPLRLCPSILLASRRTYTEGLAFLYSENTFQAHPSYLTSVLFAIDPHRIVTAPRCVCLIRRFHVRVRLDCDTFYTAGAVKEAFSGAEEVVVEVFRSSWAIGGYGALEGFVGVRGVRRAKVHGSVGVRFARWLEGAMQAPEGGVVEEWEGGEEFGWVGSEEMGGKNPWSHDR